MTIRQATPDDIDAIYDLIIGIANYEKMLDDVEMTKDVLYESLFVHHHAEVILAVDEHKAIGFALYFYSFSTFIGRANLYLEDLFVDEGYRGKGVGKKLFKELASIALKKQCQRIDWTCLNWNQSAIDFYENIGAKKMDEWLLFRLEGDAIKEFAKK